MIMWAILKSLIYNGNLSKKTWSSQALKFLSSTSLFLFPFLYFDSSVSFLQFHAWPSKGSKVSYKMVPYQFLNGDYAVAISKWPHKWVTGVSYNSLLITDRKPTFLPSTQGTSFRNDSRSLLQKHDLESQRPPSHSQPQRVPHNHEFLWWTWRLVKKLMMNFLFETNLGRNRCLFADWKCCKTAQVSEVRSGCPAKRRQK